VESWDRFRAANPGGLVMAEPDWARDYGTNPDAGYSSAAQPFLYAGAPPPHGIAPLAAVVRVGIRVWPPERPAAAGTLAKAGLVLS
jgi:hypothetical protein